MKMPAPPKRDTDYEEDTEIADPDDVEEGIVI